MSQKVVTITRTDTGDEGTVGVLKTDDGRFQCYVLELPRRENQEKISCIPAGSYEVIWGRCVVSGTPAYEITGVPNRSKLYFVPGNFAGDESLGFESHTTGGPLLGRNVSAVYNSRGNSQAAVLHSKQVVPGFVEHMGKRSFTLEVVEKLKN